MSFYVKLIEDSVSEFGKRITTMEIRYPRFIHSEIMTHRVKALNAASSRAIPWNKMKASIEKDPVVPIKFGLEQKGMQSGDELPKELSDFAEKIWLGARDYALDCADNLHNIGDYYAKCTGDKRFEGIKVHKSLPNRITEPWMWITVIYTATNWNNLFRLRIHEDAEVHFQKTARLMRDALEGSTPKVLKFGEWHLPYITAEEKLSKDIDLLCKASTARCARVSYLTQDGEANLEKDMALFERLLGGSGGMGHFSPLEHPSCASTPDVKSGPFSGWVQFRKFFKNENVE